MKPGISADTVVVLPIFFANARVVFKVSSDVANPGIISTNFITGTGLNFTIYNENQSPLL
jgi:hypothetical protein